jgi:hypothetical protein
MLTKGFLCGVGFAAGRPTSMLHENRGIFPGYSRITFDRNIIASSIRTFRSDTRLNLTSSGQSCFDCFGETSAAGLGLDSIATQLESMQTRATTLILAKCLHITSKPPHLIARAAAAGSRIGRVRIIFLIRYHSVVSCRVYRMASKRLSRVLIIQGHLPIRSHPHEYAGAYESGSG